MRTTKNNQFIMLPMLLLIGLELFSWHLVSAISDKRLCANRECNQIISIGSARLNYNAPALGIVSFKIGSSIRIFSKEAGNDTSLWGIEVNGRRGYAPKANIREDRVFVKRQDLIEVSTSEEVKEEIENTTLKPSEPNIEDSKPTTPLESVAPIVESIVKSPQDNINNITPVQSIDGTSIPFNNNIETTTLAIQNEENSAEVVSESTHSNEDKELKGEVQKEEDGKTVVSETKDESNEKTKLKELVNNVEAETKTDIESVQKDVINNNTTENELESKANDTNSEQLKEDDIKKVVEETTVPPTREPGLLYPYLNTYVEADHTTTSGPFIKETTDETDTNYTINQAKEIINEQPNEIEKETMEQLVQELANEEINIQTKEPQKEQAQVEVHEHTTTTLENILKEERENETLDEQAKAIVTEQEQLEKLPQKKSELFQDVNNSTSEIKSDEQLGSGILQVVPSQPVQAKINDKEAISIEIKENSEVNSLLNVASESKNIIDTNAEEPAKQINEIVKNTDSVINSPQQLELSVAEIPKITESEQINETVEINPIQLATLNDTIIAPKDEENHAVQDELDIEQKQVEKIINLEKEEININNEHNSPQVPNLEVSSEKLFEQINPLTEESVFQEIETTQSYVSNNPNEYYRKLQEQAEKPWEQVAPTLLPNAQEIRQSDNLEEIYQTTSNNLISNAAEEEINQHVVDSAEEEKKLQETAQTNDNNDALISPAHTDTVEHEGLFGTILGTVNSFWSSEKKETAVENDELQHILYPNSLSVPDIKHGE